MSTPSVKSLEKALGILEAFSFEKSELGISDLSEKVGLTPSTVCRLVKTLVKKGYLIKNSNNQKYRISLKVLNFASVIYKQLDIKDVAVDIMRKTRDNLKETIYIDLIDNEERVCVLSVPGTQALSRTVPVGQRSPFYAGADSRMLLASLDRNLAYSYIEHVIFKKFATNTIKSKQKLHELNKKCREMNLAISINEFTQGSAGIAIPVRDFSQKVAAVLCLAFHEKKAVAETFKYYSDTLKQAALSISSCLGYQGHHVFEREDFLRDSSEMHEIMKELYRDGSEGGIGLVRAG